MATDEEERLRAKLQEHGIDPDAPPRTPWLYDPPFTTPQRWTVTLEAVDDRTGETPRGNTPRTAAQAGNDLQSKLFSTHCKIYFVLTSEYGLIVKHPLEFDSVTILGSRNGVICEIPTLLTSSTPPVPPAPLTLQEQAEAALDATYQAESNKVIIEDAP